MNTCANRRGSPSWSRGGLRWSIPETTVVCSRARSWCSPRRAGRRSWSRPASPHTRRTVRSSPRRRASAESRARSPTVSWPTSSSSSAAWPSGGPADEALLTAVRLLGVTFQNPVLLAAGTAGFGREVAGVIDLDALGGIVTKAVTPEARRGHPAPRVAEFRGGMLNAVGLANPGLEAVAAHELPWLASRLTRARVIVNVAGATVADYVRVIERLTPLEAIAAFEINASCPNTSAGGLEFGAEPGGLTELVRACPPRPARSASSSLRCSPTFRRWPASRRPRVLKR